MRYYILEGPRVTLCNDLARVHEIIRLAWPGATLQGPNVLYRGRVVAVVSIQVQAAA